MKYIITESQLPIFLRRRFTNEDLMSLIKIVSYMIEEVGVMPDDAIYDAVRQLIKGKKFSDIDEFGHEHSYWNSYLMYEEPLVAFVKSKLGLE